MATILSNQILVAALSSSILFVCEFLIFRQTTVVASDALSFLARAKAEAETLHLQGGGPEISRLAIASDGRQLEADSVGGAEASMASSIDASFLGAGGDWRSQLQPEARQRIVNKIMETLKRHLPITVPEGLNELRKIALRFEEKIYFVDTNQSDYLRMISLKMLSMATKNPTAAPINPGMSDPATVNQNPTDSD